MVPGPVYFFNDNVFYYYIVFQENRKETFIMKDFFGGVGKAVPLMMLMYIITVIAILVMFIRGCSRIVGQV